MSAARALVLLSAISILAACGDAAPTGSDGDGDQGDVIIQSPPVTPTAPPAPTEPQGAPTLTVGMSDAVANPNGFFTSEITVTVMNWPDPVVGEKVTFTLVKGSGSLSATEVLTDAQGIARTTLTFGLADEQVVHAHTATSALASTSVLAYCAEAPEQRTLPCPE